MSAYPIWLCLGREEAELLLRLCEQEQKRRVGGDNSTLAIIRQHLIDRLNGEAVK